MASTKKISELPIISALSGSGASVIPVVVGGTTNQISAERFSEFVNAYNATTSSNTFIGNQSITGDLDVSGNAIIGGNVEVAGMITAQQYNVTYVSSSVQYKSGSTEFGDTADDTHIFTGTIVLNGLALGTHELMAQTASQNEINTGISAVTGAFSTELGQLQTQNTSQGAVNTGISAVTGAFSTELGGLQTQNTSQGAVNTGISAVTGAFATELGTIQTTLSGHRGELSGLEAWTASLDSTYATDVQLAAAVAGLNTQTGSQNSINSGISSVTGAFATELGGLQTQNTSQGSVNSGISAVTGAFATELGGIQSNITSFNNVFSGVSSVTGAFATELGQLQTQNTSQGSVNSGISAVTGAFSTELGTIQSTLTGHRGELSGLEAWTASLDSTYATDAQVAAAVAGLNIQTGSQNSINSGISAVTGAFSTELGTIQSNITSFNSVFSGVSAVTGAFSTELGQLQTQKTSQGLVNSGISAVTGAFSTELGGIQTSLTQFSGIEAYTSSLKSVLTINGGDVEFSGKLTAQEIHTTFTTSSVLYQSGSTKFGDSSDDKHEFTGSLSISGSVTASGNLQANQLYIGGATTSTGLIGASEAVVQNELGIQYGDATGTFLRIIANNVNQNTAIVAGAFSGADPNFDIYTGGATSVSVNRLAGANFSGAVTASVIYGTKITTPTGLEYQVRNTNGVSGDHIFKSYNTEILKLDGGTNVSTFGGNVIINGGNSVRLYESTNSNYWDVYTYTDDTLRVNYKGAGNDEIILYNDGGISFAGVITGSSNLNVVRAAIGSTATPTIPLQVYGQQKWFTTPGDSSELRGFFNPGGAADDAELTLYKADGVTAGIKLTPDGIDFSANANAAGMTSELLDDYEEGTWSPQIYYQDSTDQSNSTNVTQVGTYTKIGNVVVVNGVLQWTVTGSPANDNIGIKNLPFTSKVGSDYYQWGHVQLVNADSYPTDGYVLNLQQNGTMMLFYDRRSDTGNYGDDIGATGTKTARFSITYLSA